MPLLIPFVLAAISGLAFLACESKEKSPASRSLKPEDLIIGPEPPTPITRHDFKTDPVPEKKNLSAAAQEVLGNFRGSLDEQKTFLNLTLEQQRRVDQTFEANSLHGFFSSMLALGGFFESEDRKDVASKIYKTLGKKIFPVSDLVRTEAGVRLARLQSKP